RACVRCRFHRRHVSADDGGDEASVNFLPSHKHDVRGLHHRVGVFDHSDEAARFHKAERVTQLLAGWCGRFPGLGAHWRVSYPKRPGKFVAFTTCPGKIGVASATPRCRTTTSANTSRKSVVTARSR